MDFFQFVNPTKIVAQSGLSSDFSAELESLGVQKFFIVTDKIIHELGLTQGVVQCLKDSGCEVVGEFTEVPSDSGVAVIEKVAALAKKSGAQALIAIGGGSVLDTAKGANILFTLGGNLVEDYSGAQTITQSLNPLIAIPTTAGTGSEVTEAIVIKDESTGMKISFVDVHLLPTIALLDPDLTLGLPPAITAGTALDALTHSIEAIMSVQRGPIPDALALHSISLIRKSLIPCLKDGTDVQARGNLMVASTLAGMAFNHAMVGVVHAVSHTVGALYHVHHGMANAIFLPYGMEYNLEERISEIASMAGALGAPLADDEHSQALACIQNVREFRNEVAALSGMPATYEAAKVPHEGLKTIAEKCPEDGASFYNPREIESDIILPYLERAYRGE